jgi:hypothetical protein
MKERERVLRRENKALRKALQDLTKTYVQVIDLFIETSMENVGLKPLKGKK